MLKSFIGQESIVINDILLFHGLVGHHPCIANISARFTFYMPTRQLAVDSDTGLIPMQNVSYIFTGSYFPCHFTSDQLKYNCRYLYGYNRVANWINYHFFGWEIFST